MAVTRINKKQMSELDKEYEASLKSIETENKIDRIFYSSDRISYCSYVARHGDYPEYDYGYLDLRGCGGRIYVLSR